MTQKSAKNKQVQQKNSSKNTKNATNANNNTSHVQCEIAIDGFVFIEDTEQALKLDGKYSAIFNEIFAKIKNLETCKDVRNIKVNPPENHKLFFRCIIDIEPSSPIIAI
jgi:ABC-type phosphate transport system substrate-binding protein